MSVLQQIVRKAKKLYKNGRAGIKWKSAIKKAAATIKKKATGSRPARRKVTRRKKTVTRRRRATAPRKAGKPVSTKFKNDIRAKLAKSLLDYELAKTIKATKEAQKRKVKYRKILRSL